MIKINNLYKKYAGSDVWTLENISLEFGNTGMYFILGKSGSGKTTLLNMMSAIDSPTEGSVELDGKDLVTLNEVEADALRNECVSIIFQNFNILENLNVFDNVKLSVDIQIWDGKTEDQVNELVHGALSFVGLEGFQKRNVKSLSGGELQRVAIARAIVRKPKVILADEPTGNLDNENSKRVFELLKSISSSCLVVIITHDRESALKYGEGCYEMSDGQLVNYIDLSNRVDYKYDIQAKDNDGILLDDTCSKIDIVKQKICTIIDLIKSHDDIIDIHIKRKTVAVKDEEKQTSFNASEYGNARKGSLTFSGILRFAFGNMKKAKLRLFAVSMMMMLAMMLTVLSVLMNNYDEYRVIENYFNKYDITRVYPHVEETRSSQVFGYMFNNIAGGKKLLTKLGFSSIGEIYKLKDQVDVGYTDNESSNWVSVTLCFDCLEKDYTQNLTGRLPEKADEIVITDFVASQLGIDQAFENALLQVETIDDMHIVGILDTDYETRFKNAGDAMLDEYLMFDYKYVYDAVYVSSEFLKALEANQTRIYTSCADVLTGQIDNFIQYNIMIGEVGELYGNPLIGTEPQNSGEVVLSKSYVESKGKNVKSMVGEKQEFLDISNEPFCDSFIPLYEYFPDGVTVVGIYDDEAVDFRDKPYIIFSSNDFSMLKKDYYEYYYTDLLRLDISPNEYNGFIKSARELGLSFDDASIIKIMTFAGYIDSFKSVFLFVSIIMAVIVVLMIYNYTSNSVVQNRKNIGILRALGLSRPDTLKIFTMEAGIIFIVSNLISVGCTLLVIKVVNDIYKESLERYPFEIIYFDTYIWLILLSACFIIFSIAAVLPIIRFAKQKPIDVIKFK